MQKTCVCDACVLGRHELARIDDGTDAELLARLLDGDRTPGRRAAQVLAEFGSIHALAPQWAQLGLLRTHERLRLAAALELGRRALAQRAARTAISHPRELVARYRDLATRDTETLVVAALDVRNGLIHDRSFAGGTSHVGIDANDVLRFALACGAGQIALVHNHPSGDPEPSENDFVFTDQVCAIAEVCGVVVFDHVVVAARGWQSLLRGSNRKRRARST
jgi:DNA repair protein RadC